LRFTISRGNSVYMSTPSSIVLPSREGPGMDLDSTPSLNTIGFESDLDTIRLELLYNVLKMSLDREKLLKVRIPDLYYSKSLKE
jgi:hypothetical protein